jgi:AcrR family transcriptional regulator
MVRTPWGNAADLRSKRMRPGRGNEPEESSRSQRERLFGAMVAISSEEGYEATRIADLVKLAGVSRATFYEHFSDKRECMLATVDALLEPTLDLLADSDGLPEGEPRVRKVLADLLDLVAAQPAAAKVVMVEAYAAGEESEARVTSASRAFEQALAEQLRPVLGDDDTVDEMARAMIGGFWRVVGKRVYDDAAGELPAAAEALADWALSYRLPPGPLKAPSRRGRKTRPFSERQAVANFPERVLRALAATVADKGYQAATVAEVVDRASTSQRVFYGHFGNKQEAFLAALDSGSSQMLGAVLPAFRRAKSWGEAVRAAYEAMFAFGVEEPEYTRLGAVELYAVGMPALRTRDNVIGALEALLVPGFELSPNTPPIVAEATAGAINALVYRQVRDNGPEKLPLLVPIATYMTLAPFLGDDDAYERATEESEKW